MAGSLNHIVAEDGNFTFSSIDNIRDAHEALLECHQIIAYLLPYAGRGMADNLDAVGALAEALEYLGYPQSHTPIIYDEHLGPNRTFRSGDHLTSAGDAGEGA